MRAQSQSTDERQTTSPPGTRAGQAHSSFYLWYVVVLLAVVNVFNFMDRTVISVLMPAIKADLGLNDTELGLLSGLAFALFYATLGIPIAALADRATRKHIIAAALVIWSGMTAACGAAQTFVQLFLARMGVGVGEAGCLPPSHSVLGDYIPPERRSSALAIHTAGSTVGIMAGLMIGGFLVTHFGWRETFVIMGLPGVVLAVGVMLTLREPARGRLDRKAAAADEPQTLIELIRTRKSYMHLVMVFGAGGFVAFGLQQWLPSFYVRSYGMPISEVGVLYGAVSGIASTIGAVGGGYAGDALLKRGPKAVLAYGAVCYFFAFVFKIALLVSSTATLSLTFNFLTSVFALAVHGPTFALIQSVTPPHLRARAIALLTLFTSLIGTGAGPLFIGFVSDLYSGAHGVESLRYALIWCSALSLWPIFHLLVSRRHIERDRI